MTPVTTMCFYASFILICFLSMTATAITGQQQEDPVAYNFIVTDFIDVLQEGVSTQCTMFYEANRRMLKNCSSPHGYFSTLYTIDSHIAYLLFPANGVVQCVAQANTFAPLPPLPLGPQLPLLRTLWRAIWPKTKLVKEYRLAVGKYFVAQYIDGETGLPLELTNYDAMAEHKFTNFLNGSKAPDSYFDVPKECTTAATTTMKVGLFSDQKIEAVSASHRRRVLPHWLYDMADISKMPKFDPSSSSHEKMLSKTPPAFWDNSRFANPPRNQGLECGSCWAFASVGVSETVYNYAKNIPVDPNVPNYFSVQNIIDCVHSKISHGCFGGSGLDSINYIVQNGIALETDYPYQAVNGAQCPTSFKSGVVKPIQGEPVLIYPWNETAIMQAIMQYGAVLGGQKELVAGPMVNQSMYYSGGVYSNSQCSADLPGGHVIMFVGWGNDETTGQPYWLIRNSLGNGWGEGGFFKVLRGENICGTEVGAYVVYPNV